LYYNNKKALLWIIYHKISKTSVLNTASGFIDKRKAEMPEGSYTTSLFQKGTRKIAQKVGEEAVETVIAHGQRR
jgi:phosphoribosyl-ATP pyrophosphohydrolase/phosphoribosyl-AMP cyclohydrolase